MQSGVKIMGNYIDFKKAMLKKLGKRKKYRSRNMVEELL
jgi:hypothetical protein